MLCLAGTQAWRDRRRGTGDNILILGHVQMFLLSNTTNAFLIRKKLAKSPYYNITATVSMFHLSVKTTSCQTYLLLRTTPLVTVTHTWSRIVIIVAGAVFAGSVIIVIGAGVVVASDVVNVVVAFNCLYVAKVLKRLVPSEVPRLVESRRKFSGCILSVHGWLRHRNDMLRWSLVG